jgi:hypothetical protein
MLLLQNAGRVIQYATNINFVYVKLTDVTSKSRAVFIFF